MADRVKRYATEEFVSQKILSENPTQSNALDLIVELGLLDGEPSLDEIGNVLTDENGAIYII